MHRPIKRCGLLRLGCADGVGWEREAHVWPSASFSVLQAADKHLISESIFLGLTLSLTSFCILASVLNWSRVAGPSQVWGLRLPVWQMPSASFFSLTEPPLSFTWTSWQPLLVFACRLLGELECTLSLALSAAFNL